MKNCVLDGRNNNNSNNNGVILRKVHLDSEVSKNSKILLQNISKELADMFEAESIDAKVETNYHITYAYFNEISSQEIGEIIGDLYNLKVELQSTQMLNKDITYDQSLHQITIWNSNVTGDTHIVLTPHNPESIYKKLVLSKHISPHITLAKIDLQDQSRRPELRAKVKKIVRKYIQDTGIYGDISKINIHI